MWFLSARKGRRTPLSLWEFVNGNFAFERKLDKRQAFCRTLKPRLELLEGRLAPATFTVNTLADTPDPGSLRAAIIAANNQPGDDIIIFSLPGTGTINLTAQLP